MTPLVHRMTTSNAKGQESSTSAIIVVVVVFLLVVLFEAFSIYMACRRNQENQEAAQQTDEALPQPDPPLQKVMLLASQAACPICLEDMLEGQCACNLKCDHLFHYECLDTWVKKKCQCPVCRIKLYGNEDCAESVGNDTAAATYDVERAQWVPIETEEALAQDGNAQLEGDQACVEETEGATRLNSVVEEGVVQLGEEGVAQRSELGVS